MCSLPEDEILHVINKASEVGCCIRCGLCYLDLFKMNIAMYSKNEKELVETLLPNHHQQVCLLSSSRCKICFGAFQDEYLHGRLPNEMEKVYHEYDIEYLSEFHVSLTFSNHFHIREHCFKYLLAKHVESEQVKKILQSSQPPLDRKRLLKTTLSDIFEKSMKAKGHELKANPQTAPLMIEVKFNDDVIMNANSKEEVVEENLSPLKKKRKKNKIDRRENSNLQSVLRLKSLEELDTIIQSEIPAEWNNDLSDFSSETSVKLDEKFIKVSGTHSVIYISGYYRKLERGLPQSPWVMRGSKEDEQNTRSVDTYIGGPFMEYTKADSYKFDSSGREDKNVRMLGNGRPFVFAIHNPRRSHFTLEQVKEIENTINQRANGSIEVHTIQVHFNNLVCQKMKEGAEEKRKNYRCVVWCEAALTSDTDPSLKEKVTNYLESIKDLDIGQKTPLRVLHRRALHTRKKIIHSIKCTEFINSHAMVLDLCTSAGTYVKEFIHGDFGRTEPSFGTLLAKLFERSLPFDSQILQLDVMEIEISL
ncbi:predicted protein [Naegleria gruberi]|uniref:tRNA pseudouridine(55) synthase n=1 Tax=Naegleria gruberi TaxID=5762 RepID=D2W316_NAEGR|nr:uncharacterized protein NAEGRDRAFT_75786 [Naegleria gruberi]EFC36503.1 predicted protein [Naegleria gruberi]|eukprot:XP_002669247.1 predicted protein [Naegleria gruberi strain NEG-M]